MGTTSKERIEYIREWKAANVRAFKFECNIQTDADVIAVLDAQESKAAFIKAAIREYMKID